MAISKALGEIHRSATKVIGGLFTSRRFSGYGIGWRLELLGKGFSGNQAQDISGLRPKASYIFGSKHSLQESSDVIPSPGCSTDETGSSWEEVQDMWTDSADHLYTLTLHCLEGIQIQLSICYLFEVTLQAVFLNLPTKT